jgi:hypothetical protein
MFKSVQKTVPVNSICLGCWLTKPHPEYLGIVSEIRSCTEKVERAKLKAMLPAITPAGVFGDRFTIEQYSGLACIDIDGQDNPQVEDWEKVKRIMRTFLYVAYAGLSCGGNGLIVLVRVKEFDQQKQVIFPVIEKDLLQFGIKLDGSKKGGNDMRYYSYDPVPYINQNPLILEKPRKVIAPKTNATEHVVWTESDRTGDLRAFLANYIKNYSREFEYAEWIRLGIALANEIGEEGRHYFHELSKPDQRYKARECDKVYSDLLNRKYDQVSGGTLRFLLMQ